jgi:hypothetical protein
VPYSPRQWLVRLAFARNGRRLWPVWLASRRAKLGRAPGTLRPGFRWRTVAHVANSLGTGWSHMLSHGTPPGVLLNSAPAVAAGADRRLEVFVASEEAALWHIRQTAPNNGWSDWVSHGTPSGVLFGSDSAPAIAASADGRLELFVVGDDAALWHRRQTTPNGGWSRWLSHGAPQPAGLMGSPAVVPSEDGRLELFVVGTDGALWHRWQTAPNAAWSPWLSHGTPPGSSLLPALTTD